MKAVTPPLGIFRFFLFQDDAVLWSLSAARIQPWIVPVSKATDQPNKATGSSARARWSSGRLAIPAARVMFPRDLLVTSRVFG